MVRIDRTQNFEKLEKALAAFRANMDFEVQLPSGLDRSGFFGIDAACCQYLLTIVRQKPDLKLRLGAATGQADFLDTVSRYLFGLGALATFARFADQKGADVSAGTILNFLNSRVAQMDAGNFRNLVKGRGLVLACMSNASTENINTLYSAPFARSLHHFEHYQRLIQTCVDACGAGKLIHARYNSTLGELVYELFRNTDEHAGFDESGNDYDAARFRAIGIAYREIPMDALGLYFGSDLGIQSYLSRLIAKSKSSNEAPGSVKLRFLELTVIDNGPGLARRWLSFQGKGGTLDKLTPQIELEAVKACFKKYNSTKSDRGAGQGLTKVAVILHKLNAFMRLRTGTLALYQGFRDEELRGQNTVINLRQYANQRRLANAVGACYTICIPLLPEAGSGK